LGRHARIIMGTGENRRKILLRPIVDQLGAQKAKALVNWHAYASMLTHDKK